MGCRRNRRGHRETIDLGLEMLVMFEEDKLEDVAETVDSGWPLNTV